MPSDSKFRNDRGYSLAELMVVLVVLSLGILAIAKLFPTASREQVKDRMRTVGSYFAQEKLESLKATVSTDADLADGRHPAASNETVGTGGTMTRYWVVSHLPDPLANVARLDIIVRWTTPQGPDSVVATTYQNQ